MPFEQLLFHFRGPHDTRREDHANARRVVGTAVGLGLFEGADHRLRECVPHDHDVGRLFSFNRLPEFMGIKGAMRQRDHRRASKVRHEGTEPHSCTMHQRAGRYRHRSHAIVVELSGNLGDVVHFGNGEPHRRKRRSEQALQHAADVVHHPLGHAGRAPRVKHVEVVRRSGDALRRVVSFDQ